MSKSAWVGPNAYVGQNLLFFLGLLVLAKVSSTFGRGLKMQNGKI